ncbi:MAG: polysaccharide deacetylase family protein [Deltaproteobacteria bacterium]|nr:polysaccharide deacetylase family protein [Deltaproteobacteria bacterium]
MARVTLTIDNGPDPEVTPHVLDVLARRNVRASFFVLGSALADPARRRCAERARAEGHWIGNHTYTHAVPFGQNEAPDAVEREVVATERLLGDLAHEERLFRPFGGGGHLDERLLSRALVDHLTAEAYTCVLWNAVPRDWEPHDWVSVAVEQIRASPWSVLVVHDVIPGNDRRIDDLLARLEDRGDEVVQAFAPDCVPIRRGEVVRDVAPFVGR